MAKDRIIESHIAESRAKIEKAVPETVDTERHIDRARQVLDRSRQLLEASRDPLQLATLIGEMTMSAAEDRPSALQKKRVSRKTKAQRQR